MKNKLILWVSCTIMTACSVTKNARVPDEFPDFFREGHRGTRGLMPENTIPAMKKAIDVGANVLEMDVYTTKDGQVLVAHDPVLNTEHSLVDGKEVSKNEAKNYAWHQMDYSDIRKIDVGSKYYKSFPQQVKINTYMPLLGELIDSVEAYVREKNLPLPVYNIELKNSVHYDSLGYNASPEALVEAVMKVLRSKDIGSRFYLQSFDMRPLQYIHHQYPGVVTGFLTDNKLGFDENIKQMGFYPDIYSPQFNLVNKELADQCKKHHLKLIPWTVNDKEKMKSLISLGVDGIITDYPNYFREEGIGE